MLRFLLVLALLVGLGTPAQAVTPKLRGADPLAPVALRGAHPHRDDRGLVGG